jgi:hypothetical protein
MVLIHTTINVIQKNGDITALIVASNLAVILFFTGITLVRTTKDEA